MTSGAETKDKRAAARVLLVDDEPKLRESIAEGLRLEGWAVSTAATGAEALALFRGNEFDLLVLDWMLPDIDGMEILRRVRAHAPRLPVLMITARCSPTDQATAFRNGATGFLTKPFAFDDLLVRSGALIAPALRAE
jgi:two-component system, OmpR family, response regulator